jgi:hypothetical protein
MAGWKKWPARAVALGAVGAVGVLLADQLLTARSHRGVVIRNLHVVGAGVGRLREFGSNGPNAAPILIGQSLVGGGAGLARGGDVNLKGPVHVRGSFVLRSRWRFKVTRAQSKTPPDRGPAAHGSVISYGRTSQRTVGSPRAPCVRRRASRAIVSRTQILAASADASPGSVLSAPLDALAAMRALRRVDGGWSELPTLRVRHPSKVGPPPVIGRQFTTCLEGDSASGWMLEMR